jgi:hypothetical protein
MKKHLAVLSILMLSMVVLQAQTKETRNVGTFTRIAFRVPGKLYLRQGSPQKVVIEGKKDILQETETEIGEGELVIGNERKRNWDNDDKVNVYITVKDIEGLGIGGSGDLIAETKIITNNIRLYVSGSGNMSVDVDASANIGANVSGSGNMDLKGKCKDFEIKVTGSGKRAIALRASGHADFGVSGSGKIEASGAASKVKASISGSGKVLAANLETNSCEVLITGSGDVEINVKNELDVNIIGSGNVRYKGDPSKVKSHSAGSGHVGKL